MLLTNLLIYFPQITWSTHCNYTCKLFLNCAESVVTTSHVKKRIPQTNHNAVQKITKILRQSMESPLRMTTPQGIPVSSAGNASYE
jgi:hypothetical protein